MRTSETGSRRPPGAIRGFIAGDYTGERLRSGARSKVRGISSPGSDSPSPENMNTADILRMAELAALAVPADPGERKKLLRAREMVRFFTALVLRDRANQAQETHAGATGGRPAGCSLRPDVPRPGFDPDTVPALAPARGARLVRVPRVL